MRPTPMITSVNNTRLKEARKLQRRRQRIKTGQLLIEGVRLIRDGWLAGVRPEIVFYVEELLLANEAGNSLLAMLQAAEIPCFPCLPHPFTSLSETVTPQGIAAIVPLPQVIGPLAPNVERRFILILDGVRDPGNAGTLLRSAEAAGVDFVLFGPGTVDPFNDKVVRAGMGAHFRLPIRICQQWAEIDPLFQEGYASYVAQAHSQLIYDQVDWCQPSLLIVGGEAFGPSHTALAQAQPLSIPMLGSTESLNAASAGTVMLFEAARQRRIRGYPR